MNYPPSESIVKAGLAHEPTPITHAFLDDDDERACAGVRAPGMKAAPAKTPVMNIKGYEKLQDVLERAYAQAAIGKGRERHARNEAFDKQVMQIGAQKFGVGSLLFQAFKKSEESQRLPQDRAVAELLGAINYLAGAVIALEAQTGNESTK